MIETKKIQLPNGWVPRKHQLPLWHYIDSGGLRAAVVWHRRAGKDSTGLNLTACQAHKRIGTYWHLLPEAAQGRKAIWDGIDKNSRRIIDQVFPEELRARTIDNEMKIELKCGSFWNVVGSDNYNSLVGSNPIGVVLSEYSLGDPAAWDYLRPILAENGGWAMFLYTPRGANHGKKLFDMAKANPKWFAEILTVDDTLIIPPETIAEEIASGMDDDMVQQEYFALAPDTRVLTADLRWVPIADLVASPQDLIGIDECAGSSGKRKLRQAKIVRARHTARESHRIDFTDGRSVVASIEHPWLVRSQRPGKNAQYDWIETRDLRVADTVVDTGLSPWVTDTSYDGGWLAGLYDGEGCVSRRTVSVAQKPGLILDAVRAALRERGLSSFETQSKGCHSVWCSLHDSLRLLGTIRPKRLLAAAARIWSGAYPFNGVPAAKIVAITSLGVQPVVAIETSAKTFIAEGLVTHNCSWQGVRQGSIYGDQLKNARQDQRIGKVPHDRRYPVNTFWDIGHGDATSIIAHQVVGAQDRFLRSYEQSGADIPHFFAKLKEWSQDHGFLYGKHFLPHDAKNTTLAAKSNPLGKNVWDQLITLGVRDLELVPRTPDLWTAINLTRTRFSTAYFDAEGCSGLLDALASYHKKWDDDRKCYQQQPYHDWSSNYCDAFRMWAQGYVAGGSAGTFTLPTALPAKMRMMPAVQTVGSNNAGY